MRRFALAAAAAVAALSVVGAAGAATGPDANGRWIAQVYLDVLGRSPDASTAALFADELTKGATRTDVALQILNSPEYRAHVVNDVYEHFLGRTPSPTDLSLGVAFLGSGSDEVFKAVIMGSSEYYVGHGGGTDSGFVSAVVQDVLGRTIAPSELSFLLGLLASSTRSDVALSLLTSAESRKDMVVAWYQQFLHRSPGPTELSFAVGQLAVVPDETVIAGILGSAEYLASVPDCPAGSFFDGVAQCTAAPAGSYVALPGLLEATPCPVGYYQPKAGQTSCLAADSGHFVASTGQPNESECPPGRYQPNTAATDCLLTPPGTYSGAGAANATPCVPGFYQPNAGASSCVAASPGHYVADAGRAEQLECPAGFFQPNTGATSCFAAHAGRYVPQPGSATETECAPGTYQPNTGATSCFQTPPGTYSGAGAASATPCAPGYYQPNAGATSCFAAPPGTYVPASGAIAAIPCPLGTSSLGGATSCSTASALLPSAISAATGDDQVVQMLQQAQSHVAKGLQTPACRQLGNALRAAARNNDAAPVLAIKQTMVALRC